MSTPLNGTEVPLLDAETQDTLQRLLYDALDEVVPAMQALLAERGAFMDGIVVTMAKIGGSDQMATQADMSVVDLSYAQLVAIPPNLLHQH